MAGALIVHPMAQKRVQNHHATPRESITFARRPLYGAKAVGSFLPGLTAKALQKYGFSTASLILDWPAIVGREIAQYAAPECVKWPRSPAAAEEEETIAGGRRSGAVLVLRVDGAKALEVQYRARQIIDRINAYFGYAAIAQLRVVQAPVPALQPKRGPRAKAEPLAQEVAGIADARLRDALARLGAEIRTGR
jgi:hypothetical protein